MDDKKDALGFEARIQGFSFRSISRPRLPGMSIPPREILLDEKKDDKLKKKCGEDIDAGNGPATGVIHI